MTKSRVGWLPRDWDQLQAQSSLIKYGTAFLLYVYGLGAPACIVNIHKLPKDKFIFSFLPCNYQRWF